MLGTTNLIGGVVAIAFLASAILVFITRLMGRPQYGHWIGYFEFLLAVPLVYLLLAAPGLERPLLYYIQIGLVLAWLLLELLLDYLLRVDFRKNLRAVIAYVTLFFAASGGMVGVAANAGPGWSITAVILFLVMAVLAFTQRAVTGM